MGSACCAAEPKAPADTIDPSKPNKIVTRDVTLVSKNKPGDAPRTSQASRPAAVPTATGDDDATVMPIAPLVIEPAPGSSYGGSYGYNSGLQAPNLYGAPQQPMFHYNYQPAYEPAPGPPTYEPSQHSHQYHAQQAPRAAPPVYLPPPQMQPQIREAPNVVDMGALKHNTRLSQAVYGPHTTYGEHITQSPGIAPEYARY